MHNIIQDNDHGNPAQVFKVLPVRLDPRGRLHVRRRAGEGIGQPPHHRHERVSVGSVNPPSVGNENSPLEEVRMEEEQGKEEVRVIVSFPE